MTRWSNLLVIVQKMNKQHNKRTLIERLRIEGYEQACKWIMSALVNESSESRSFQCFGLMLSCSIASQLYTLPEGLTATIWDVEVNTLYVTGQWYSPQYS